MSHYDEELINDNIKNGRKWHYKPGAGDLVTKVSQWHHARNLINGSTDQAQFVKLIEDSSDTYVNLVLNTGERLVLDKEVAFKSDVETMKRYGIDKKQRL